MRLERSLLVVALLSAASEGYLLSPLICYYCEDCTSSAAVIQPCGLTSPILTTPSIVGDNFQQAPQYSSEPILTPPPVVGGGGSDTIFPQYPDNDQGSPLLTPPTIPTGAVAPEWNDGSVSGASNSGVPVLTTIWPGTTSWNWWSSNRAKVDRYICVTAKYTVGNRQVIYRGCSRQGRSNDDICSGMSKGKYQQCTLCTSPLCNNGK
ncbi:uncharacterized protein LOC110676886 [Aedes aegypti]|uniref:Uncharacterized protein n=1 Tax=Aedes aegypti TaxID=7159 RepID=A0A6I8TTN4_AEDAE|nr:uncharacterized protein LOC110676886 [Aedes aegypti]